MSTSGSIRRNHYSPNANNLHFGPIVCPAPCTPISWRTMWLLIAIGLFLAGGSTTAPTTYPVHRVTVPQGFVTVKSHDRTAVCEPSDRQWIQSLFDTLAPTTRPSTMPSNLLSRVSEKRKAITADLSTKLAL